MELPDFLKGISTIGQWDTFWWGARWELTNSELDRAIAKIDVQRNLVGVIGGA